MTQFSSGKHEKVTADPEPHVNGHLNRQARPYHGQNCCKTRFQPRAFYDRPLTNPANPILESVRADAAIVGLDEAVGEHLAELDGFFANSPAEDFGQATVDHARAVLTRLAALA